MKTDVEKAAAGKTVTVTAEPDEGYKLVNVTVDGKTYTETSFTFEMPAKDVTVAATFVEDTPEPAKYAIKLDPVTGGTGTLHTSPEEEAAEGEIVTVTVTPDKGFELVSVTVDGKAIEGNTFEMPAADVTVSATLKKVEYTVTCATAENGTVTASPTTAAEGDTITVTATPAEGCKLKSITVNGKEIAGTTFTMPAENVTVAATFEKNSGPDDPDTPITPDTPDTPSTPTTSGCYIATSVYGSYDAPEVWTLRRFRDNVLADSWYGRLFIKAYYATSPTLVRLFGENEAFQSFWRGKLDSLVDTLQAEGFEATPYQDINW